MQCKKVEPVDMYTGDFRIVFDTSSGQSASTRRSKFVNHDDSGEENNRGGKGGAADSDEDDEPFPEIVSYDLRASNGSDLSRWSECLSDRIEWALTSAKSQRTRKPARSESIDASDREGARATKSGGLHAGSGRGAVSGRFNRSGGMRDDDDDDDDDGGRGGARGRGRNKDDDVDTVFRGANASGISALSSGSRDRDRDRDRDRNRSRERDLSGEEGEDRESGGSGSRFRERRAGGRSMGGGGKAGRSGLSSLREQDDADDGDSFSSRGRDRDVGRGRGDRARDDRGRDGSVVGNRLHPFGADPPSNSSRGGDRYSRSGRGEDSDEENEFERGMDRDSNRGRSSGAGAMAFPGSSAKSSGRSGMRGSAYAADLSESEQSEEGDDQDHMYPIRKMIYGGKVKKKSESRYSPWQDRYMRLCPLGLYLFENEKDTHYSFSIAIGSIVKVSPVSRDPTTDSRALFMVSTEFQDFLFRCKDREDVREWISAVKQAMEKDRSRRQRKSRKPRGHVGADDSDTGNAGYDSDASDAGMRKQFQQSVPPWFRPYMKPSSNPDDLARWMVASQKFLDNAFANIYDSGKSSGKRSDGDDDGTERSGADANGSGKKINMAKLSKAVLSAVGVLEERVLEAKARNRPDVAKHLITFSDTRMLQELDPQIIESASSSSSLAILQLLDCIETYIAVRRKLQQDLTLTATEARPGLVLRENRRTVIEMYVSHMAPRLHEVVVKVLQNLRDKKGDLVCRTIGTRVGTKSPTDMFNLLFEHLKIAKEGGSNVLQRRLLSSVMAEVVYYAQSVLTELMDWWKRSPQEVDMDYVVAVINDAGVMLDHIEQLEDFFAEALKSSESEMIDTVNRKTNRKDKDGNPEEDELDRQESERAKEDLAAIGQDIPRAKGELISAGCSLTSVLVDIQVEDLKEPMANIFTPQWEKQGNLVSILCATIRDYLDESKTLLDPFFFNRLACLLLAYICEGYVARLLVPDSVKKLVVPKGKEFKGGFSSRFKLSDERRQKIALDIAEITQAFKDYVSYEDSRLIMQALVNVRDMLTINPDDLMSVFESGLRNAPAVSTHVYLSFEKVVAVRDDLDKKTRKSVMTEALQLLHELGQPPDMDDDDMMSLIGSVSGLSGASASHSVSWSPSHVTESLYKALFPTAGQNAKVLFKNWSPPSEDRDVPNPVHQLRSADHASEMSLSSFMGGGGLGSSSSQGKKSLGGGGGGGGGSGDTLAGLPFKVRNLDDDDAFVDEDQGRDRDRSRGATKDRERGGGRSARGRGGDDDDDDFAGGGTSKNRFAARGTGSGGGGSAPVEEPPKQEISLLSSNRRSEPDNDDGGRRRRRRNRYDDDE